MDIRSNDNQARPVEVHHLPHPVPFLRRIPSIGRADQELSSWVRNTVEKASQTFGSTGKISTLSKSHHALRGWEPFTVGISCSLPHVQRVMQHPDRVVDGQEQGQR